ncbi:hypothetical protein PHLGIDRAFT_417678 [Phlebiopsis gigantea 11061_1 CR5-6]|uniref:Uncharacterized protein n=1 Tax=Phlebiopsis gigantea (strain 11061_1 CR5-6) TaxID=745531 RepID=A0A0C3SDI5_PHLG1|nr:hypothetical protein PHLGIDRAFT_417678 [Phlebiopsis gigantea 11061_1 CR5-6]
MPSVDDALRPRISWDPVAATWLRGPGKEESRWHGTPAPRSTRAAVEATSPNAAPRPDASYRHPCARHQGSTTIDSRISRPSVRSAGFADDQRHAPPSRCSSRRAAPGVHASSMETAIDGQDGRARLRRCVAGRRHLSQAAHQQRGR